MRCPTCGTENTPDSRFCGGCGAKLVPETSRVAPTAKISDDAPFPPQRYPTPVPAQFASGPTSLAPAPYAPPGPASIPPTSKPASIPPANNAYAQGPASIPPNTYQAPASIPPNTYQARPASIPPTNAGGYAAREPSMSLPALPQTRWGLIAVVLLLDIGLAAAGAVMLQKGLAKPEPESAPAGDGSAKPAATSQAAAPAPVAAPAAVASPAVGASIATIANATPGSNADPKDVKPGKNATAKPVEPVQAKKSPAQRDLENELGAEIELAAARSRGDFDKCYDDASPEIHLKGRVDIAFTVLPDGRVQDPHVTQNDTGSQPLASCLVSTIGRWAFASHPAKPVLIARPFIYN
ncbi:MAG TPA: AgmX/PglI C-terminal domain-containing protein [Kofleriaceae bacterium]